MGFFWELEEETVVRTGGDPWKQRAPKSGRGRPTESLRAVVRSQVEETARKRPE